jgi:hypothetical protein
MKHLFCQAQIWRFGMPRQRRFVNPWWADAIIAHEFSVIFDGLLPTFHVFFPAFKTTLSVSLRGFQRLHCLSERQRYCL